MALIVGPGITATPPLPSADDLLGQLRGKLTLSDVADSPQDARYAVSSVDAANMPLLTGVQPTPGLPWPSSAGVTQFNGYTGSVAVPDIIRSTNQNRVALNVAGSGSQIGDPRNLPPVISANYQSAWSGMTMSYTATPTTAAISTTAATLHIGNLAIPYNAASANVTGTAGTTVPYYLYFNDPTYAGGTQTLIASTGAHDMVTNSGYVNIGSISVVFPASGTGGGTAPSGCPSVDAWVIRRGWFGFRRLIRAGSVRVGDRLLLIDGRWGEVTYSQAEMQPCRLIETVMGTLVCSDSAPLLVGDGRIVTAKALAVGEWLHTDVGFSCVRGNVDMGREWVQHITCQNAFFWCRSTGIIWFAHHNMKRLL